MNMLASVFEVIVTAIFVYFIAMHGIYFILIILGMFAQKSYHQGIQLGELKRIEQSALSLPVSIVVSAYNEEKMIIPTLQNVLLLRYPEYEIIVVNDGSEDRTLELLIDTFHMQKIDMVYKKNLEIKHVRAVYRSALHPKLIVIDKENGRRADANNAGVDYAHYPIICQIDADCVLEPDALLHMIRPFLMDSKVIAATAIIRPSNGLIVDKGKIIGHGIPKRWMPIFQYVEYLRAFQWARSGLTLLKSNLCMSGAYTIIRKDIFLKVGGANAKAVVDDFELTVTIQRFIHEHKKTEQFKLAYVPDPGCYSEVPETLKAFASQRNFWQRAILQSLIWNRDMAFNPRYGMVGLFGFPFFLIFEALSPLIELSAYILMPFGYLLGVVTAEQLLIFFIFSVCLGAFVSVCAVLLEQTTRMKQKNTRDIIRLLSAGFLEHFGFHQFHLLHRLIGIYDLLIRQRISYGYRVRTGYNTSKNE